jgi:Fur family ferric uptake transcriptional regulator
MTTSGERSLSSLKTIDLAKSSDPSRCEDLAHAIGGQLGGGPVVREATNILEQLRARGERITTPRRAVIELLTGTSEHFTVDEITERLHTNHPSIAPSTVYRTLEALQEWGMVEKIHRGQGATFFHLTQTHQHLVCSVCNKVSDIPAYELADLASRLRDQYGFTLEPNSFALLGQCVHHHADDGSGHAHP